MLGTVQLESSSLEKDLSVLVDSNLNKTQQCAVITKKAKLHWEEFCQALEEVFVHCMFILDITSVGDELEDEEEFDQWKESAFDIMDQAATNVPSNLSGAGRL
ncbi:hypothetical protein BTVI_09207 [Pitangus sulphuratus]|nr:hypothetical protein BTVI_09207 [Pitangus sulphuratus]